MFNELAYIPNILRKREKYIKIVNQVAQYTVQRELDAKHTKLGMRRTDFVFFF